LCCVFVYFYFNPAFGLQLSLIKLSWVEVAVMAWVQRWPTPLGQSFPKGKGKGLETWNWNPFAIPEKKLNFSSLILNNSLLNYMTAYMSQTREQERFTISEVAVDWHEPMVPQRIMWPSIPTLTDNWTHGAGSRHTITSIRHNRPSPGYCQFF